MMLNLPLVYIIVLNWNGWKDTIICINSLLSIDYHNYKILVVDNGSSDNSVEYIRQACPTIDIIETGANLGFAGGVNVGIKHVLKFKVEFLWVLNNDSIVSPASLNEMVKTAQMGQYIGAVGSTIYHMDNQSKVQALGGGGVNLYTGASRHKVDGGKLDYITGASMLIRRSALEDIGLFDANLFFMYWEDVDFCLRLKKSGWQLSCAEHSIIWHKEGGSQEPHSPLLDAYFDTSAVHFFRKHSTHPFIPILLGAFGRFLRRLCDGELQQAFALWKITFKAYNAKANNKSPMNSVE